MSIKVPVSQRMIMSGKLDLEGRMIMNNRITSKMTGNPFMNEEELNLQVNNNNFTFDNAV